MTTGIIDSVNENNATNTEGEEFTGVAEPQAPVSDNSDNSGDDTSNIEKQLKDTQAAFTRSRQEIAALKSHISVLEEALQNNDTVMIGDLAEYEICPRLLQISNFLSKIQA